MPRAVRSLVCLSLFAVALSSLSGCASLQSLASLPQVDFHVAGTSHAALAGIELDGKRGIEDLRPADLLRIAGAVRSRQLPLRFDLHVGAENTSPHTYDLRLQQLEWTLLLEERETVSGVFTRPIVINASGTTDIPLAVELDLLRFFDQGANDLARLALRVAGVGGPVNVKLRARPTFATPLGPVRLPNDITIAPRPL